jgi:hypothetical protein
VTTNRLEYIASKMEEFSDLPPEVFFKEDLLRLGLSLGRAFQHGGGQQTYQEKSYFIFSFDRTPITGMSQQENLRAPEEIALTGGPFNLRRTIVSVRLNPASPYLLGRLSETGEGGLGLWLEGELIAQVELPPKPAHYGRTLASGKPIVEMAPVIEWGYLIYLTAFRRCQYVGTDQECRFCDINSNFDQQRAAGRVYTTVKEVDEVLEALDMIAADDTRAKAYTLTGGSITSQLRGQTESAFYLQYARAIEGKYPGRWIGKAVMQAMTVERLLPFRDAGIRIYHPNYEVWDEKLFEWLCPGKSSYIGRATWIERILDAREVFGASNVIPNFVGGVEMARPHGFTHVEQAVASTGEGLDFFMSHGITPRFTTWCPEPLSDLLRDGAQEPAPLEYHLRLLQTYRDTLAKHKLAPPPGYGAPGAGNAVFSVSSFMDVLPPATLDRETVAATK